MNQSRELLDLIGPDAMQKLCDHYGGLAIYIPKSLPRTMARNEDIKVLFSETIKDGSTMSAYERCADEFGLSVARVRQIANGN